MLCLNHLTEAELLSNKQPLQRLDLGPTFFQDQRVPVKRELLLDLDMDAYNDVKKCCLKVCERCWPIAKVSIAVTQKVLTGIDIFLDDS